MSPVKGSDLAQQIELAREDIERWPEWLKEAAAIGRREPVGTDSELERSAISLPITDADFID